jgi:hypothetical protein
MQTNTGTRLVATAISLVLLTAAELNPECDNDIGVFVAMNYPVKIDSSVYRMLQGFLSSGVVEYDGKTIDFSPVQHISIANGTAKFSPPAKVSLKYGLVTIKTTLSAMTVQPGGIKIEVDHSPIDMELKPNE